MEPLPDWLQISLQEFVRMHRIPLLIEQIEYIGKEPIIFLSINSNRAPQNITSLLGCDVIYCSTQIPVMIGFKEDT
jgi:hypothetical protein